jgi:integrase
VQLKGDRLGPLYTVLCLTGLRRGEALGLRWEDLDLEAGRMAIRQNLTAIGYELRLSTPKTNRSTRVVALDARTVAPLRSWRKQQAEEKLAWGPAYVDHGLVFCRQNGELWHPQLLTQRFKLDCKRAGLPAIRLHDTRHSFATVALEAGISPKVVAEMLGHESVATTLNLYSHVSQPLQATAADLIANRIFGA